MLEEYLGKKVRLIQQDGRVKIGVIQRIDYPFLYISFEGREIALNLESVVSMEVVE